MTHTFKPSLSPLVSNDHIPFAVGDRVRMTEEYKTLARGKCGDSGKHVGPFDPGGGKDDPGGDCWGCSTAHIEEFGDSVGIVDGLTDYNNMGERDPGKIGPEVDIRWQPNNLRYAYDPKHLKAVGPGGSYALPSAGTKEHVTEIVRQAVRHSTVGFIGDDPAVAVERFRKAVLDAMMEYVPVGIRVEVLEEDNDTKVVREIMEEPNDVIQVRVTLPVPIDYISLTVKVGL